MTREIVFQGVGPYYIAQVDDTVIWANSLEEDGDFKTHQVEPSNKFTLQELWSVEKFEVVGGETSEEHPIIFMVDRADNYCYALYVDDPQQSQWGFCPI